MLCIVLIALEVQIVYDCVLPSFLDRTENDLHVKLAPAFFGDLEWRIVHY